MIQDFAQKQMKVNLKGGRILHLKYYSPCELNYLSYKILIVRGHQLVPIGLTIKREPLNYLLNSISKGALFRRLKLFYFGKVTEGITFFNAGMHISLLRGYLGN